MRVAPPKAGSGTKSPAMWALQAQPLILTFSRKGRRNGRVVASIFAARHYAEKELPQPHTCLAFGFANTNPLPFRPSVKSSSVPARKT